MFYVLDKITRQLIFYNIISIINLISDDTKSPTNDHPAKSQADIVAKNVISLDVYYEALCPDSK